ncbi:MAG: RidA family protein [Gammaproteobacteria bacterium]|jgi:2-iminobutanoate/2-iminopropanoate deaminase|uniref:RidA family protein n=1 Tax=Marinomonas lutimaris TaxID=2846746 RepID=UPI001CA5CDB4|nr:RidA family protein [Marinomonas lutimaris]MBU1294376.1 RidA family protein [Gammaproteobacteria bacterium]MBU1467329.1 RidA family protein [Gammaproteobacteria bacterium]MBU2239294.1 RidA family protein [Gammaproteobacteria bacterium]MBU2320016.1 RidA family protein [Gammaproteobacteria bacterium]MBU2411353.1 RidA family protein [Gammaproteobacteria bacterium]
MSIKRINPPSLYDGTATGMSQATVDTDTGLVFISGQVDWDTDFQTNNHDMKTQTANAAKHLITVLEAANSSVESILQLRVYVRGEVADHMEDIVPIIASTLGTSRPALTGIGVASLASPETLIEIEAVAKIAR